MSAIASNAISRVRILQLLFERWFLLTYSVRAR